MLCPFVVVLGGMFFLATALFFLSDRAKAEQQWVTWQLQMGRYRSLFSLLNVMLVLLSWPWSFQVKDVGLCVKNLGSAECMRLHEAQGLGSCWLSILYTLLLWWISVVGHMAWRGAQYLRPQAPCTLAWACHSPAHLWWGVAVCWNRWTARWRARDTLQSLVVNVEPTVPSQHPVPCSLPPIRRNIRQGGRKVCVGTYMLKGCCNKDSLSQSLIAACKKKATVFQ